MPLKNGQYFKSATLRWSRKQKPRASVLSGSMISQPLGDFRHLSHIGLDESFGDVSVFQRSGSLILHGSHSDQNIYQHLMGPPPPKPPRLLTPEEAAAQARRSPAVTTAAAAAPTHKKCHSLPLLDEVEVVGVEVGLAPPSMPCREKADVQVWGGEVDGRAAVSPVAVPLTTKGQQQRFIPVGSEDIPLSLNLDLGPSILDDVLRVMDRQ